MLKVAVIGVGHLGKAHARIYHELPEVELIAVVDTNEENRTAIAKKYNTQAFENYHDILGKVDAVSVVTPTTSHYDVCRSFLENNVHVLVEKPITTDIDKAEKLVELSCEKNIKLQVGHIERFNPIVMEIAKRKLKPIYIETVRSSPFRFRSGDIGVTLDLMIHDIDIIRSLVDAKVKKVDAVGINLLGEKEDIANARIQFENGCVANINVSRASFKPMRKMQMFCSDSYVSIDYQLMKGTIYRKPKEVDLVKLNYQQTPPKDFLGVPFEEFFFDKVLQTEQVSTTKHEPLYKELESFVECIRENKKPQVSGEDGVEALRIAKIVCDDINENLQLIRENLNKECGEK
ncbi:Gfo/Idh/MocA family oxidoreductase [Candidatus Uabimicrobium sp. HlEnr_7]|uniref:Gfo/Idh/MocA family oxidoreductase n=1 Tax=Candidatus Uabimicrobium helgolandensis TaxID=3095367 RepID=UPI003557D62B